VYNKPGYTCKNHTRDKWSLITTCDQCDHIDKIEYIVVGHGSHILIFDKELYDNLQNVKSIDSLECLKFLEDKSTYYRYFEEYLHCKYIRYRYKHHWCSKSIELDGIDLIPVVDRSDFKIYISPSGYKIFLVEDFDYSYIHKWVEDHPIVIHQPYDMDNIYGLESSEDIIDLVVKNKLMLRQNSTLRKLLYLKSIGCEDTRLNGLIKLSMDMVHNQRTGSKGIIIVGPPGVGKTFDLSSTLGDVYWLPYDHTTKNYYDGYIGQTNLVIDDLGHYSPEEWKILIRLVNDAPWRMPMAIAENKDLIGNVSQNVLVTTNSLSSLFKLPVITVDAICRRFDCYEYVGDKVMYKRYNIRKHKYEMVYAMSREDFRYRLLSIGSPVDVVVGKYENGLLDIAVDISCDVLRLFRLSGVSRMIRRLLKLSGIKYYTQVERAKILSTVIGTCVDMFYMYDWSGYVQGKESARRYVSARLGKAESLICGKEIDLNFNNIYTKSEDYKMVRVTPSYTVPSTRIKDLTPELAQMYGIDDSFGHDGKVVPEKRQIVEFTRYKKKSNLPYEYGMLDDEVVVPHGKTPFPVMKKEFVSIIDESDYKPYNPITIKWNYRKMNEYLHHKTRNKTMKRREQRHRAKMKCSSDQ